MRHVLPVLIIILVTIYQSNCYKCSPEKTCPAVSRTPYRCCNPGFLGGLCCPASGSCCYHEATTKCCKHREFCCWDQRKMDVRCCPEGSVCCPEKSRHTGCCVQFKTPIFIWIMIGICGGLIVFLLIMSLYQCIQEEYLEYQNQRSAGNLPSDNAWYYYDYGSTLSHRSPSASGRRPPEYEAREAPPAYSSEAPGSRGNRSSAGGNSRPKPPTPQNGGRQHGLSLGAESRESDYHSSSEGRGSEFYSSTSHGHSDHEPEEDPGQEVMRTFYEHSVPKLQRMLCSEHHCVVGDGSCTYCMDDDTDLSEAEIKSEVESECDILENDKQQTEVLDIVTRKSSKSMQDKKITDQLFAVHNHNSIIP